MGGFRKREEYPTSWRRSAGSSWTAARRPTRRALWQSDLPTFHSTAAVTIRGSLQEFVRDDSPEQDRAWRDSIPLLQREAGELLDARSQAAGYGAVLEYQLPLAGRRPDVIVLAEGAVVVPTRSAGTESVHGSVYVVAPYRLDAVVGRLAGDSDSSGPELEAFLDHAAYCPLPTLVQAARELFHSGKVREIWRARSVTEPAVRAIAGIAHEAAATRTRHLVLVNGVPGAGKTLVGMRAVHAHHLDDLSVPRRGSKLGVPGLYLTGNAPLAEVLQYELRKAGGGGATFVRHIKWYLAIGVPNDYMSTKNVNKGAWFAEGEEHEKSCRRLDTVMTEFGCQGLELEMVLLTWGTDLIREAGSWTSRMARRYRPRGRTQTVDPFQMRLNAYRVLLTRGRDGTIVLVPLLPELDETWKYLGASGFRELDAPD